MKNQKIKDEMNDELKVYLLALNQLDARKALEKDDPDKYNKNYRPIEDFILKQLKAWNHNIRRT